MPKLHKSPRRKVGSVSYRNDGERGNSTGLLVKRSFVTF